MEYPPPILCQDCGAKNLTSKHLREHIVSECVARLQCQYCASRHLPEDFFQHLKYCLMLKYPGSPHGSPVPPLPKTLPEPEGLYCETCEQWYPEDTDTDPEEHIRCPAPWATKCSGCRKWHWHAEHDRHLEICPARYDQRPSTALVSRPMKGTPGTLTPRQRAILGLRPGQTFGHPCLDCNEVTYAVGSELTRHRMMECPEGKIACNCGESYRRRDRAAHMAERHPWRKDPVYHCHECGKKDVGGQKALRQHQNIECPMRPVTCRYCQESFSQLAIKDHKMNCANHPALKPPYPLHLIAPNQKVIQCTLYPIKPTNGLDKAAAIPNSTPALHGRDHSSWCCPQNCRQFFDDPALWDHTNKQPCPALWSAICPCCLTWHLRSQLPAHLAVCPKLPAGEEWPEMPNVAPSRLPELLPNAVCAFCPWCDEVTDRKQWSDHIRGKCGAIPPHLRRYCSACHVVFGDKLEEIYEHSSKKLCPMMHSALCTRCREWLPRGGLAEHSKNCDKLGKKNPGAAECLPPLPQGAYSAFCPYCTCNVEVKKWKKHVGRCYNTAKRRGHLLVS
ncbi:hypothetical protein BC938DRAFT_476967 [Jimgerdemannia flammicorona]|uniref:TRAF-type domain-containing protein n=1 Tax=Jimgerdemannia flammicorona TaxID=994334 RepID=A0A433QPW7_9FUNG|nr:hypothetical protein BC938DRAFT_476967 [Jimgerdemannia flammicorona]